MRKVEFTDDLVTGVRDIDRHHRALIAWANRLFEAEGKPNQDQIVERTLTALIDYIAYHFKAEEHAMEKYGYPGIESHQSQHARLTAEVERLTRELEGMKPDRAAVLELHFFVEDWIRHHIKHVDGAFSKWVKAQKEAHGFRLPEPDELKFRMKRRYSLDNVEVVHSAGVMTPEQIRARLKY